MLNNNFNATDIANKIIASLIEKPVVDALAQLFTQEQINVIRAFFMYTSSKNILSKYLDGNNLYREEIFDLKQYALSMQDSEVIAQVLNFLQYPSAITAKAALDAVSQSESQYLAKQIAAKLKEDKK